MDFSIDNETADLGENEDKKPACAFLRTNIKSAYFTETQGIAIANRGFLIPKLSSKNMLRDYCAIRRAIGENNSSFKLSDCCFNCFGSPKDISRYAVLTLTPVKRISPLSASDTLILKNCLKKVFVSGAFVVVIDDYYVIYSEVDGSDLSIIMCLRSQLTKQGCFNESEEFEFNNVELPEKGFCCILFSRHKQESGTGFGCSKLHQYATIVVIKKSKEESLNKQSSDLNSVMVILKPYFGTRLSQLPSSDMETCSAISTVEVDLKEFTASILTFERPPPNCTIKTGIHSPFHMTNSQRKWASVLIDALLSGSKESSVTCVRCLSRNQKTLAIGKLATKKQETHQSLIFLWQREF
eukprot:GHVP01035688.1.p1 GENE.GHVP01035688.1~~GHVP01035688.1.p1  ORF type:complete len:354 (-),score=59.02 GHVP01035688.1:900-1961(-)